MIRRVCDRDGLRPSLSLIQAMYSLAFHVFIV